MTVLHGWLFACALWALSPSVVLAQTAALQLEAPARAACITSDELIQRVESRVGAPLFSGGDDVQRQIRIRFFQGRTRRHGAELRVFDAAGAELASRTLKDSAQRCRDLDDGLVVIVSTWLGVARPREEPSVPVEEPPPEPPPEPPAPPPAAAPAAPAPEPARAARVTARLFHLPGQARASWRWGGALAAVMSTGSTPRLAWGVAAHGLASYRALQLQLGALLLPRSSQGLGQGAEARFAVLMARALACARLGENASVQPSVCAGADAGAGWMEASGLGVNRSSTLALVAMALGAKLTLRARARTNLVLGLFATLPVVGGRYVVVENDGRKRAAHLSEPGVMLELGLNFWGAS